jgi:hypothetical protein
MLPGKLRKSMCRAFFCLTHVLSINPAQNNPKDSLSKEDILRRMEEDRERVKKEISIDGIED